MEAVPVPAQDDPSTSPETVKIEEGSRTQGSGRASPPPNCAICLGTCRNKSFTDSCLHQFCFKCLLTWSKVKAVCPLCKQNFRSIIHNVRSNHQYEEYMVEQRTTENDSNAQRTFRYSTTITMPRHESIAIQQLLLQHYPLISNILPVAPRRRRSPHVFRRSVYRHNLWARPLPDFTGRFRDCNPDFYRYNDSQMHRLMPWIRRELTYLLNDNQGQISYVMARILELLPQYHIHSTEFKEAMQRYLGDRTEHFLHELYCFASTPYDMTGYDRHVQYTTDTRVSTVINEVVASSDSEASVDSDIVMISSSEPAEPAAGPSRTSHTQNPPYIPYAAAPAPDRSRVLGYPQNYIPTPARNNVIPIETISPSDTDDDSEVMVVGYIKPPADRTPEIVDLLGSDSDVIVQDTPSEPAHNSDVGSRSGSLVKISLKCHKTRARNGSESEDSTYSPPRRKRRRSADTATTADTHRATPSPATSRDSQLTASTTPSMSHPSSSSSSSSYATSFGDLSSDSYESTEEKRRVSKRKIKRKRSSERSKNCKRSKTRSHHKVKKSTQRNSYKISKRKSNSGKGVKSSKTKNDGEAQCTKSNTHLSLENQQEPVASTSGISNFKKHNSENSDEVCRPSHESRRLKSVVRVITRKKSTNSQSSTEYELQLDELSHPLKPSTSRTLLEDERGTYSGDPPSTYHNSSESEDNLPLNLTIQRT